MSAPAMYPSCQANVSLSLLSASGSFRKKVTFFLVQYGYMARSISYRIPIAKNSVGWNSADFDEGCRPFKVVRNSDGPFEDAVVPFCKVAFVRGTTWQKELSKMEH
jgi:hypothetical protein